MEIHSLKHVQYVTLVTQCVLDGSKQCKTLPDEDQVGHLISPAGWNWCESCLVAWP